MPAPDRPPVELVDRRDLTVPRRARHLRTRSVMAPPVQVRQMVRLDGVTPRPLTPRQPQEIQERGQVTRITFLVIIRASRKKPFRTTSYSAIGEIRNGVPGSRPPAPASYPSHPASHCRTTPHPRKLSSRPGSSTLASAQKSRGTMMPVNDRLCPRHGDRTWCPWMAEAALCRPGNVSRLASRTCFRDEVRVGRVSSISREIT